MRIILCFRTALLILSFFLCASCGFHLQGAKHLSPKLHRLYVQSADPYGLLVRYLRASLKMSDVILVSSAKEADAVLVILQDNNTQELLASNGTLQTRQYKLKVTVSFEITDAQGKVIVPAQTLSDEKPITIQANQVLGSSNEVNLYYQQLRQNLAYAIMNRLASREITLTLHSFKTSAQ